MTDITTIAPSNFGQGEPEQNEPALDTPLGREFGALLAADGGGLRTITAVSGDHAGGHAEPTPSGAFPRAIVITAVDGGAFRHHEQPPRTITITAVSGDHLPHLDPATTKVITAVHGGAFRAPSDHLPLLTITAVRDPASLPSTTPLATTPDAGPDDLRPSFITITAVRSRPDGD